MYQNLQHIQEEANAIAKAMDDIRSLCEREKRDPLPDEEKKIDDLFIKHQELRTKIRRAKQLEDLDASSGRQTEVVQPTQRSNGRSSENRIVTPEQARRDHSAFFRGHFDARFARTPQYRESLQRLGMPSDFHMGGNTLYAALPYHAMRSSNPSVGVSADDMARWNKQFESPTVYDADGRGGVWALRDLEAGTTTGSYAVQPSEMLRALEVALLQYGGMREVATITRTDSGVPLPFPTMNDTSNKGQLLTETTQDTTELDPTFAQTILNAYTYTSKKVYVSVEFMQDNAINFEARIGEILGIRIARILNDHFTTGTGSSAQPTGIVTAATSSTYTTAASNAITYTELMKLEHSVDPAYRARGANGAKWMFADSALLAIKSIMVPHFSGDTGGYPLWRPGLTVAEPDTIDGYQYVVNQSMPAFAATNKAILFGMLSKYQIRDVRMIEVVRLNELRAEYREVEWFAFYRGDGNLLDAGTHPVKYITMHA